MAHLSGEGPSVPLSQTEAGTVRRNSIPVKTHVGHLLTKLGCRDRAQLVMHAYESRLAVPGQG
jgi:hypothetical protein